jgi:hypothetical protein
MCIHEGRARDILLSQYFLLCRRKASSWEAFTRTLTGSVHSLVGELTVAAVRGGYQRGQGRVRREHPLKGDMEDKRDCIQVFLAGETPMGIARDPTMECNSDDDEHAYHDYEHDDESVEDPTIEEVDVVTPRRLNGVAHSPTTGQHDVETLQQHAVILSIGQALGELNSKKGPFDKGSPGARTEATLPTYVDGDDASSAASSSVVQDHPGCNNPHVRFKEKGDATDDGMKGATDAIMTIKGPSTEEQSILTIITEMDLNSAFDNAFSAMGLYDDIVLEEQQLALANETEEQAAYTQASEACALTETTQLGVHLLLAIPLDRKQSYSPFQSESFSDTETCATTGNASRDSATGQDQADIDSTSVNDSSTVSALSRMFDVYAPHEGGRSIESPGNATQHSTARSFTRALSQILGCEREPEKIRNKNKISNGFDHNLDTVTDPEKDKNKQDINNVLNQLLGCSQDPVTDKSDIAEEPNEAVDWKHDPDKKRSETGITQTLNEFLGCQSDPDTNKSPDDHASSNHSSSRRHAISEAMSVLQDQFMRILDSPHGKQQGHSSQKREEGKRKRNLKPSMASVNGDASLFDGDDYSEGSDDDTLMTENTTGSQIPTVIVQGPDSTEKSSSWEYATPSAPDESSTVSSDFYESYETPSNAEATPHPKAFLATSSTKLQLPCESPPRNPKTQASSVISGADVNDELSEVYDGASSNREATLHLEDCHTTPSPTMDSRDSAAFLDKPRTCVSPSPSTRTETSTVISGSYVKEKPEEPCHETSLNCKTTERLRACLVPPSNESTGGKDDIEMKPRVATMGDCNCVSEESFNLVQDVVEVHSAFFCAAGQQMGPGLHDDDDFFSDLDGPDDLSDCVSTQDDSYAYKADKAVADAPPYITAAVVPWQAVSGNGVQTQKPTENRHGDRKNPDDDQGRKSSFAGSLRSRYETSRIPQVDGRADAPTKVVVAQRRSSQAQQHLLTSSAGTLKANQESRRDRMIQLAKSKRLTPQSKLDQSESPPAATKGANYGLRIVATAQTGDKYTPVAVRGDPKAPSAPTTRATNVSPPNTHTGLSTSATKGAVAPPPVAPTGLSTSARRRAVITKSSKLLKSSRKGSSNDSATMDKVTGPENRQEEEASTIVSLLYHRRQRTNTYGSTEKAQEQRDATPGSLLLYGSSAYALAAFLSKPTTNATPAVALSLPQPTKTPRPAFMSKTTSNDPPSGASLSQSARHPRPACDMTETLRIRVGGRRKTNITVVSS